MKYRNNTGPIKFFIGALFINELRNVTTRNFKLLPFYYEVLPKYRLKEYADGSYDIEILVRFSRTEKILFGLFGEKTIMKDVWINENHILFDAEWNMKIVEFECQA